MCQFIQKKRQSLLLFICCFAALLGTENTTATGVFELSAGTRSAYEKIISLRFVEARTEIEALKKNEPKNLMPYFIENYYSSFE